MFFFLRYSSPRDPSFVLFFGMAIISKDLPDQKLNNDNGLQYNHLLIREYVILAITRSSHSKKGGLGKLTMKKNNNKT